MNYLPGINYLNNVTNYLSNSKLSDNSRITFGKFCPSEKSLKNAAYGAYILGIGYDLYIRKFELLPNNDFVFCGSTLCLLGTTVYSIKKENPVYFTVAGAVNSLVGIYFKTMPSFLSAVLFSIVVAMMDGCSSAETPKQISNPVRPTEPTKQVSNPVGSTEPPKQATNPPVSLTEPPNQVTNPIELPIDILPCLIAHLDQKFCFQKNARDALVKAVVSHYANIKNTYPVKNHIALHGFSDSRTILIIREIAEVLGIEVIEFSVLRSELTMGPASRNIVNAFKEKIKDWNQQYIIIEHLGNIPFKMSDDEKKFIYSSPNFLNIFISDAKIKDYDQKKQLLPGLPQELIEEIDEVIQFTPLTKEDYKAMLYDKNFLGSFYQLREELMKKNMILNVDEIPAAIVEKCLRRTIMNSKPAQMVATMKKLLSFIVKQYSNESTATPIPVYLTSLPDNFAPSELTMTGMKAVLDEHIVGQDAAKQAIIEAIFFQQQACQKGFQTKLPKGNALLVGPSGSGKTYIVETIARSMNIPMASMDISRVTREGYTGPKINEVFYQLIESANGDLEKASKGIIFLDEVDKIFEDTANGTNEITGLAIQNQLLCMLQGDTITVRKDMYDKGETYLLKTENILFIMAGAFHKLIKASQGKTLDDEQLIAGGIRPEFLGRIGYISQMSALTQDQIKAILSHGPNAPLTAWKKEFEKFGFKLVMKEETINQIVANAMQKETGARGLHYEIRKKLSSLLASLIMEQENLPHTPAPGEFKVIKV